MQPDGIYFKSSRTGKTLQIKASDIEDLEWLRVARGYEVKVIYGGDVAKFDGFKESVSLS